MRNYEINKKEIELANVIYCITSPIDYEMTRLLILENIGDMEDGEYMLIESYHCSCYGFEASNYEATIYTEEELLKVLKTNDFGDDLRKKAANQLSLREN